MTQSNDLVRSVLGMAVGLSVHLCSWTVQAQTVSPAASASVVPQAQSVGTIKVVTGLVNLQSAAGKSRFAAAGSALYKGDIINTQAKSTAVLEFIDSTQVALRPGSRFVVENYEYQPEQPIADKAEFKLVKGGLRTLTGLIGKRGNADAFSMKSETATIGIRGTDFTARICKGDECNRLASSESDKPSSTNTSMADVAGRVSQLNGELTATDSKGKSRAVPKGSAVFAGDEVRVSDGGFAVLVMADSTRLTLPGGSSLQVAAYRYAPASPDTSVASFKLLKGAVRAVTGAIGKAEPKNVKFFTETATVGIRGTALDMSCTAADSGGGVILVQCSSGAQFTLDMRDGSVQLTSNNGSNQIVSAGQSALLLPGNLNIQLQNGVSNLLNRVPNAGPLPEQTPPNFESLSSTPVRSMTGPEGGPPPGDSAQLFVAVNDGTIVITNGQQPPLMVNRGEGAFVQTFTNLPPQLLVAPPDVIVRDNTLSSPPFSAPKCAP
ncbi:FecR domain-containing protein [Limnobacter humi]|uniref:FecR domain-containing protein n=1 Tax=Limnobacter humi TaxID=1778671 RepID=A0ABT1WFI9_9BURK|nr:FecR family protein [Limnobacter humi]MCQ8896283.1 FecR domain-containing protein [Limnobacter humi]